MTNQITDASIIEFIKSADSETLGKISRLVAALEKKESEIAPGTIFTKAAKSDLRVGMKVVFTARKTKPPVSGIIKSINKKTATVEKCSDGSKGWRVGFGLLYTAD